MRERQRIVRAVSLAGLIGVLAAGCTYNWAGFRGGADRLGFNPDTDAGSIGATNVKSVAARMVVPIPGLSDNVDLAASYALDNQTPPIVTDTKVYVNGVDGYLHALDLTGHQLWQVRTNGEPTEDAPTPALAGNQVFVAFGAPEGDYLNSYAADTGALRWSRALTEPVTARASAPAVDGNMVFVANGFRVSQYRTDGLFIRDYTKAQSAITAPVAVAKGLLYEGTDSGGVRAERIADGTEAWVYTCENPPCNEAFGVAVSGGITVLTRRNGHIKALYNGTDGTHVGGHVAWDPQNPATGNPDYARAQPVIAYNRVYEATQSGSLVALDLATGNELFRSKITWRPKAIGVSNGVLYTSNPLRAYDANTGVLLAKFFRLPGIGIDFEGASAQGADVVIANHAIWQIDKDGTLWKFGL